MSTKNTHYNMVQATIVTKAKTKKMRDNGEAHNRIIGGKTVVRNGWNSKRRKEVLYIQSGRNFKTGNLME